MMNERGKIKELIAFYSNKLEFLKFIFKDDLP